jgi:hypothetical protein
MVITSFPLPKKEAGRLNTLVNFQPKFTLLNGQFSADDNTRCLSLPSAVQQPKPALPDLYAWSSIQHHIAVSVVVDALLNQ